jgi:hypothetical protein
MIPNFRVCLGSALLALGEVVSETQLGNYQRSQGTYAFGVFSTLAAVDS